MTSMFPEGPSLVIPDVLHEQSPSDPGSKPDVVLADCPGGSDSRGASSASRARGGHLLCSHHAASLQRGPLHWQLEICQYGTRSTLLAAASRILLS